MNKLVIDANVFFKLLRKEADSQQAIELITHTTKQAIDILVPAVMINEVLHTCERQTMPIAPAHELFKQLMGFNLHLVNTDEGLLDKAIEITQHGHDKSGYPTFSDSLYHALAIKHNTLLITADNRHKLKTEKQYGHITLLSQWQNHIAKH